MFPREHGAWSLLLQPFLVAAILARTWHWSLIPALIGVVVVFIVRQPLITLARQQYVWKTPHPETAEAWRWLAGCAVAGAASGIALVFRWPFDLLAFLALAAAVMTLTATWATIRNRQRSTILQIVSAGGLTASTVAAAASSCSGQIPGWVWWLWGAMALQATASILVVHARLEARIRVRKSLSLDRPDSAYGALCVLLLAAVTLGARGEWILAAALAIPAIVHWVDLTAIRRGGQTLDTPLTTIGFRAMGLSIASNLMLVIGLWPRSGCGL